MRSRAREVYAHLVDVGCVFDGERYPHGEVWLTPGMQVFFLPDPDPDGEGGWFDAEVLDDNLKDRWSGLTVPLPLRRYG